MADLQISPEIIEELQGLLTEGEFNHRWMLVETYHEVGRIICSINANRTDVLHSLAPRVGKSVRSLWYATKFYEVFPDLNTLPEGKNISWNKIIRTHLTTSKQDECTHENKEVISFEVCKDCKKNLGKVISHD